MPGPFWQRGTQHRTGQRTRPRAYVRGASKWGSRKFPPLLLTPESLVSPGPPRAACVGHFLTSSVTAFYGCVGIKTNIIQAKLKIKTFSLTLKVLSSPHFERNEGISVGRVNSACWTPWARQPRVPKHQLPRIRGPSPYKAKASLGTLPSSEPGRGDAQVFIHQAMGNRNAVCPHDGRAFSREK